MKINRNSLLTLIFSSTVLAMFLGFLVFSAEDELGRRLVDATMKTLIYSIGVIVLLSLAMRSLYFWKVLLVYSTFGFFALSISYYGYAWGKLEHTQIFEIVLKDYLTYLRGCGISVIGVTIPIYLLFGSTE